jgi:hypothetical protein
MPVSIKAQIKVTVLKNSILSEQRQQLVVNRKNGPAAGCYPAFLGIT